MPPLLLAQSAEAVNDGVNNAIDWSERASQLGVAGICLFIMFLAVAIAWWVMRKNSKLNEDLAEKEKNFRTELSAAQTKIADLERGFRTDTERLLREMIERGEDTGEALNSNSQALRDVTQGLHTVAARVEWLERMLERAIMAAGQSVPIAPNPTPGSDADSILGSSDSGAHTLGNPVPPPSQPGPGEPPPGDPQA